MSRLDRFLRHSPSERCLLVKVSILLVAIRWSLRFLSFQSQLQLIKRFTNPSAPPGNSDRFYQEKVLWAVNRASRHISNANSCLPRALAAHILLKRRGLPVRMYIGVRKDDVGLLRAHAWVESDGVVIIGRTETGIERYTALPDMEGIWL